MNKYDGCSLDRTFCDTKECNNMDCYRNPNYIPDGSKWISFSQFKNTDECIGFKTLNPENSESSKNIVNDSTH